MKTSDNEPKKPPKATVPKSIATRSTVLPETNASELPLGPAVAPSVALRQQNILAIQRTYGNRAAGQFLQRASGHPSKSLSVQRDPEADRIAQWNKDYAAAVAKPDWQEAARLLNGGSEADITAKLQALSPAQRRQLLAGARQVKGIGDGNRLIKNKGAGIGAGKIFGTVTTHQNLAPPATAGDTYGFEFDLTFHPDPTVVNCTEIAFVQTSRVIHLGTNTNAEYMRPQNDRRNANDEAIDRVAGKKLGWYGYDNSGTSNNPTGTQRMAGAAVPASFKTITPGSAPTPLKDAVFFDRPQDNMTGVSFNFETAVIARSGPQANLVYSVVHWGFDVTAAGVMTAHPIQSEDRVSAGFGTAVDAWNAQASGPAAGRNAPDQQSLPTFQ